jgi:hypothetical protein
LRKRDVISPSQDRNPCQLYFPFDWINKGDKSSTYEKRSVTTWAPTYVELVRYQLLAYANLINGLKPWKRGELKSRLDVLSVGVGMANNFMKRIKEVGPD